MAELGVHRIVLLVVSLMKCLEGTKLLADFKKCGDLECETLISRVLAIRDYRGTDCRFLNFTKGEEISVYVKLAGEREDLWAGSKGKDFGYFPRDAVHIEEVFISEEVKISTKHPVQCWAYSEHTEILNVWGQVTWEMDSEIDLCIWEGCLGESTCDGTEENTEWAEREKLNCDAFARKVSADSIGNSEAGMVFQSPEQRQESICATAMYCEIFFPQSPYNCICPFNVLSGGARFCGQESDFFCLLEESYTFENEDSELDSDNGENIYSYEEDKDQISSVYANDFQIESGFYSISESTLFEDQFPTSEAPEDVKITSKSKDWEGVEAGSVAQDPIPEVDHSPPSSAMPEVKGWFGFGMEQAEEQTFESVTESLHENSFQSRNIAMEDENYLEELNDGEPQIEHKQKPESESHSMPQKQPELVSESEHIHKTQTTGWFGGGFTSYLGFGGEDRELELLSQESNLPPQDVPNSVSSDEEPTVPCTETLTEKEDTNTNGSSILIPNWFDFGFGVLSFAYANEDKIKSDDERKEGGEGDKHEHSPISEFDFDEEQRIKITKTMETEDKVAKENVLEKIDDSDTVPYFQKFLNNFDNPWNFQNSPKKTELPFSEHVLDEINVAENDETELFSGESYPTDDKKIMMLKGRYSKSGTGSDTELPNRVHEEAHFKNPSKNHGEISKTPVYTEASTQVENDRSMENNLLNNEMFSGDYSLSSQNYIAQKEGASEYQILKYLFQWDVYDFMNSAFTRILILTEKIS